MKMRTLLLAALLASGFLFFTSSPKLSPTRWGSGALGSALWSGPDVAHSAGLGADELSNIDIYKRAHMATVNITSTVYRRDFFFNIYPAKESGSGFLVNDEGLIVTNNHVVSGSAKLQVTLADQSRYEAQILDRDQSNDLALIQITPKTKIIPLSLGDSDKIQVGQKVLAIGNPFGLSGTLTTGVISSLGRDIRDESGMVLEGMMQTDSAINPGNSGGPLLDSQGNVVGVNTAIYGPGGNIGIGFAMPINRAKAMMDAFQSSKKHGRPTLGVTGVYVSGDLAEALELPARGGMLVYEVTPGSPAQAIGMRGARRWGYIGNTEIGIGGDLIMAIDGKAVEGPNTIRSVVIRKKPGDKVELTLFREGRTLKLNVALSTARSEAL
ncbi:MAG: trypsin-like peptidase domain-containing protein [Acidobacteriia bacterium]|nr:trypsin-like peptidase domain-containing protein [Terriglobia bacterium]